MKNATGFVFYRGPSMLDGAPIVGIATLHSRNVKTGNMVQTWIMREDIAPHTATKTGHDTSVCGDCPLRPSESGVCYVLTFQGPRQIWESYHGGTYADYTSDGYAQSDAVDGRMVRLGAYGDPAAIPRDAWDALLQDAKGCTGYTHQWRRPEYQWLQSYCQASCDSPRDVIDATRSGWGTFYVIPPHNDDANLRVGGTKMIACPYTKTGVQCAHCGLCNGRSKRNIVVRAHGNGAKKLGEIAV